MYIYIYIYILFVCFVFQLFMFSLIITILCPSMLSFFRNPSLHYYFDFYYFSTIIPNNHNDNNERFAPRQAKNGRCDLYVGRRASDPRKNK